jgi:hypothetical protein
MRDRRQRCCRPSNWVVLLGVVGQLFVATGVTLGGRSRVSASGGFMHRIIQADSRPHASNTRQHANEARKKQVDQVRVVFLLRSQRPRTERSLEPLTESGE